MKIMNLINTKLLSIINWFKTTNLYKNNMAVRKIFDTVSSTQFIRFFIIGISTFAIDFLLLSLFILVLGISSDEYLKQTLANIASAAVAIVINFVIQKKWAFQSTNKSVGKEASKFIVVHIFNLITYQTILFSIVNFILPAWFTKIIVTAIQIVSSFILYKHFVFKTKTTTDEVEEETVASGMA